MDGEQVCQVRQEAEVLRVDIEVQVFVIADGFVRLLLLGLVRVAVIVICRGLGVGRVSSSMRQRGSITALAVASAFCVLVLAITELPTVRLVSTLTVYDASGQ